MNLRRALLLVAALELGSCGPKVRPDYPVPSDEDDPLAHPAHLEGPGPEPTPTPPASAPMAAAARLPPPASPPVEVIATGTIPRGELAVVLDAGPSAFFRALPIEPAFSDKRFEGWQIRQMPPSGPIARADLFAGDVVTRVNGKVLQRPEEFQDLWDSLRFATELVVDYRRNGEIRQLRFAIGP